MAPKLHAALTRRAAERGDSPQGLKVQGPHNPILQGLGVSTSKPAVILQSEHPHSENVMFAHRGVVIVLFCPGASEFSRRLCLHSYYSVYFIYSSALLDFNKVFSC